MEDCITTCRPAPIQPGLDARSRALRRVIVDVLKHARRGHIGSAFSCLEIVRVLYDDILRYDAADPAWPERDRFIFSKGHGCLALYSLLADKGFFPKEELQRFCRADSILGGHPERGKVPGVEASTGSLGHGFSIGVGMAVSARQRDLPSRVFVLMGDGECNEGSVWEAALSAGKHGLSNLTVLVDYNKQQSYSTTKEVLDLEPFADKWTAFGFAAEVIDGHDVAALRETLQRLPLRSGRPTALICDTIKGKGIPFIEGDLNWHHKSRVSDDELEKLLRALD